VSLILVVLATAFGRVLHTNATTAALGFLLVVLATATAFGLVNGTVTSLVAVVVFNYYFLPPIGTLTIQDPQNWIAFTVFFITAITASQLSGRAQEKAKEARAQRLETERLYEFSRAILVDESPSRTESKALAHLVRIFGLRQADFFSAHGNSASAIVPNDWIRAAQIKGTILRRDDWVLVPVELGGRYAGTLALQPEKPDELTDAVAGSIANLLAIGLERRSSFERVAAAEAARRNDELRTALLDGLAHELKTPLTAIKTSATALLEKQDHLDNSARELLGIMDEEVNRLQEIVGEAIETGRIESGQFAMRKGPVSVNDMISGLIQKRESYRTRVRFQRAPQQVVVSADPDLLNMALRQLLDNAMRYSPESEPVDLRVDADAQSVSIHVHDNGPGICEAEQPHVFEKYYQGISGRRVAGGSGLGLAVAKRVVEAHGGEIALECSRQGSTFVIRIPRASDAAETLGHS
jgi:two-component system, OmpR family, sensor histidine kinase KdpD